METATKQTEKQEAIAKLRDLLPPGSTVYTVLRHVARSGMQRSISVIVQDRDGPRDVDYLVRRALGLTFDQKNGGLKVRGCGMDMGFHLAYELSARLYPEGHGCTGEKCHSNDHNNGDRDFTPNGTITGQTPAAIGKLTKAYREPRPVFANHWHRDGGYALAHRWL